MKKKFGNHHLWIIAILVSSLLIASLQATAVYSVSDEYEPSAIRVEKIKFYYGASSSAIQMIDHVTDKVLPVPEWDYSAVVNEPACYVRGTTIDVQVKFKLLKFMNAISHVRIWATGSLGGLNEQRVGFINGESPYVTFEAVEPLPNVVSVNNIEWEWWFQDINGMGTPPMKMEVSSMHEIFAVWDDPLDPPIYKKVTRWTTQWASGAGDMSTKKDIADAIISNIELSGLHYGYPAWSVDDILDTGGGMCGGWYKMFHEMCGDQGVFVNDRCYILKRDAAPYPEIKWIGIVIKDGGLNNPEPTWPYRTWYDVDYIYPYPDNSDVQSVHERRYIFYSPYDGHCVNFLSHNGHIYLYDASFGTGPWPDPFDHIPSGDYRGPELHDFRQNYHDIAIDHMEGTVYMSYGSTRTLDIKSSLIPDLLNPLDPSSWEMHYNFMGYGLEEKMEELRLRMKTLDPSAYKGIVEPDTQEYKDCIEKVNLLLDDPKTKVDWLEIQEALIKLQDIGNSKTIPTLIKILERSEEIVLLPNSTYPSSMSPLNLLKTAAIDCILKILDRS